MSKSPRFEKRSGPENSDGAAARGSSLPQPRDLLALLGGHVSSRLGLDLSDPDDPTLGRWLLASALVARNQPERAAIAACVALRSAGLFDPESIARAPADLESLLARAEVAKPEVAARLLVRLATSLLERYDGSVSRLASEAEGLEALAGRLAALAPGFGRAAVFRYLAPLRGQWHAASDLPLSAAAHAAAVDVLLIDAACDAEGAPAVLARRLAERSRGGTPECALRDLEAALEKLGRAACLRRRAARCPLEAACPRRRDSPPAVE